MFSSSVKCRLLEYIFKLVLVEALYVKRKSIMHVFLKEKSAFKKCVFKKFLRDLELLLDTAREALFLLSQLFLI